MVVVQLARGVTSGWLRYCVRLYVLQCINKGRVRKKPQMELELHRDLLFLKTKMTLGSFKKSDKKACR
jgi:hypothetical protein